MADEEYQVPEVRMLTEVLAQAKSLGAQIQADHDRTLAYQYKRCIWDDVNDLARQGWILTPVISDGLHVMARPRGVADDAAEFLGEKARSS